MSRGMQIASGISVLFTTLAFGHIMVHQTQHFLSDHEGNHFFIVAHTLVAIAFVVLSLTGAYGLLAVKRPQNSGGAQ